MICYFASRSMEILASASTELREGLHIRDDKKVEEIEVGQDTFSGYICYQSGERLKAEMAAEPGNYILRNENGKDEFYTIIESESDPVKGEVYFYAESAGLDLIGEICEPYTAKEKMTLAQYISKWITDTGTGFQIGVDQTDGMKKALMWEESETAAERVISTAAYFSCEVSYRFVIDRLSVKHKYIDFYRKRGSETKETLRRGRDFEELRVRKSLENIATCLRVTGGIPNGSGIRRASDDTYTWVKFSDTWNGKDDEGTANMSDDPDGMYYAGIACGMASEEESENPENYLWGPIRKRSLMIIKPSVKGHRQWKNVNGKARYVWIMFATDEEGSNMSDQPADRTYVGYAVNKTSEEKSTLPEDYTWIPMDGRLAFRDLFISPGTGGISEGGGLYTWIKFADDAKGRNMSNSCVGKSYIGLSYHRTTANESSQAADYIWKEIKLNTNDGGFVQAEAAYPGIRQQDGTFIWVKFAKGTSGESIGSVPTERPYIGLAYDKTDPNADFSPATYEWTLLGMDDENPVTLKGVTYDDGDFYVDAFGRLYSRRALEEYSRYLSPDEQGTGTGHIVGEFTSKATSPDTLLQEALEELRRRSKPEITYEIEIERLPETMKTGDTIRIADPEGNLYLSARILKTEASAEQMKCTVTLGEYVTARDGISAQIAKLTKKQRETDTSMPKYQWIVYADSPMGDGIRLEPEEAVYMGVAYNKVSPDPDLSDPYLYEWTQVGGVDGNDGANGEDATTLRIDSTRGLVFKNNWYSTQLRVTVIKGAKIITDVQTLHAEFGAGAYLQWYWRKQADDEWSVMSVSDSRITEGGFAMTVTPTDVDEQITFQCDLVG